MPELLDLLALSPLQSPHIRALLSEPSPQDPTERPPMESNRGLLVSVQSVQARVSSPKAVSLLFAVAQCSFMKSSTVLRLELNRCCALFDNNTDFIPSFHASASAQKQLLHECNVILNVDESKVEDTLRTTRHVLLDVQDFVMSLEDESISSLSCLYHAFMQRAQAVQSLFSSLRSPRDASQHTELNSNERVSVSESGFRFSLQEEDIPRSSLPTVFSLAPLQVVLQDVWPEVGQLVVVSTVSLTENEDTQSSVLSYPSLDYYRLINGGVPHPLTADSFHKQMQVEKSQPATSFFSFFASSQKPTALYHVTMQFRLPSMIRVFSMSVKQMTKEEMNALAGSDIASVFGDSFEFDLLAWSEMNRSFHCIKSVCVPISPASSSLAGEYKRSHYYEKRGNRDESSTDSDASLTMDEAMHETVMENTDQTDFFEMTPPYSYSNRYQICVYLRGYAPGEMTALGGMPGVVKGVTQVVQKRLSLKYFISLLSRDGYA